MTHVLILGANGQLARNTTRVFLRDTEAGLTLYLIDLIQGEVAMNVIRSGSQPSTKGSSDYFMGTVRVDTPFQESQSNFDRTVINRSF